MRDLHELPSIDHPLSDMVFGDHMRPWWQAARDLFTRKQTRNWRDGAHELPNGRLQLVAPNGRLRHTVAGWTQQERAT